MNGSPMASLPAETTPRCAHFGACGGCQVQHLRYDTQLAAKQQRIAELLLQAGVRDLPPIEMHHAEPWHYRNRIRLRIERVEGIAEGSVEGSVEGITDEWRFGYNRRASHAFLPVHECPIAAEPLWTLSEAMRTLAGSNPPLAALLEASGEVELFVNEDLSGAQAIFLARSRQARAPGSFASLLAAVNDSLASQAQVRLAGLALVYADPQSGRVLRTLAECGAGGLGYRVEDELYWISRGGFFQVNRFLLGAMVDLVTRSNGAPRAGDLAWDLFAGVGLFARVLARRFKRVTAVEANPIAVADLRGALQKISPASEAVQATTLAFLRGALIARERPDLVVLDPPRAGAGIEACRLLARLAPAEIVYVSCDPTTLARDLAVLQDRYRVVALHGLDLFPQTTHVETVAVLSRSG